MAKPETMVETENPVVVTTSIQPEILETIPLEPESADVVSADVAPVEAVVVQPTPQPVAEVPREEVATIELVSEAVVEPVVTRSGTSLDLFGASQQERVVSAVATTPTIDEASDTVVVASVAAIEPVPVPVGNSAPAAGAKGKLLPLRSVLADFTELKASPTRQSRTLLSLGRGVIVTAFERHGKWIHIGTNDGSSITGYVLESSLGKVNTKNSG